MGRRAAAFQGFHNRFKNFRFIFYLDLGAYQQAQAGKALLVFFLHQLIVQGAAAKTCRQHLFQNVQHFTAD